LDFYEGDWIKDRYDGIGEAHFANGDIYVGEFENDKRHGTLNFSCFEF
jgi:hypothetical protein